MQTCEADLGLGGLGPGALGVLERGDRLGELEEDLALDAPPPDPLAAPRAAVAPVGHDEAEVVRNCSVARKQGEIRAETVGVKYSMRIRGVRGCCDTDWASPAMAERGGPCEFILGRFAIAGACGRDSRRAQRF